MHSMDTRRLLRARASRWAAALAAVVALAPLGAAAQTNAKLPQGYTSDALPALPPGESPSPELQAQQVQAPAQPEQSTDPAVDADGYADTDPSALSDFQEPLAPYGAWVEDPTYGTVWVPSSVVVGTDFAPYQTAGHWTLDEDSEWMWVSDYDWGYIPFHYGRWVWIPARGWAWIPGRVYAPAWVVWRTGDYGYIGWAPMPPAFYWTGGVAVGLWLVPPAAYVFVPTTYVFHTHVHHYVVRDRVVVHDIAAHTPAYHKPANASVGHHGAAGAQAHSAPAPSKYKPASPSLAEAKVPPGASPKSRAATDPRAAALSRRSSSPRATTRQPGSSRLGRGSFEGRGTPGGFDGRGRAPVIRTPRGGEAPPAFDGRSRGRGLDPRGVPAPRSRGRGAVS